MIRDEKIINVTSSRRYFFFTRAKFDANNGLFKENLVKYKGKRTSQDVMFIVFSSLSSTLREEEENNLPQMKPLFFLYVWLNFPYVAQLCASNLAKHIKKITIQTGRLFFSSSLIRIFAHKGDFSRLYDFAKQKTNHQSLK